MRSRFGALTLESGREFELEGGDFRLEGGNFDLEGGNLDSLILMHYVRPLRMNRAFGPFEGTIVGAKVF